MQTDALIATLSLDPQVKGRTSFLPLGLWLAGILGYCVLAILLIAGARPDFAAGIPWVAAKAGLSLLFGLAAAPLLIRLACPGRAAGIGLPTLSALIIASALASLAGLAAAGEGERLDVLTGGGFPICAVIIPILACPAAGLMFIWLRAQAPTRPALAGMAAGVLAGAIAAMAYALTCPVDSVAFVATWYPLAIAICAALGAVAGAKALRW